MIKSMTGYAAAEKTAGEITVTADMRAYNNRHLDIVLRIPPSYMVLEDKIKALVTERIARGRVEIRLQIKDESEQAVAFEIDRPRAKALYRILELLKKEFKLNQELSIEHLLNLGGIIKPVEQPSLACFIATHRSQFGSFAKKPITEAFLPSHSGGQPLRFVDYQQASVFINDFNI